MITRSKLRKYANAYGRKAYRKNIIHAYKLICKNIKSRAKKGNYSYSFRQEGYSEELEIAFRLFSLKHRDLQSRLIKYTEQEKSYEIRW